MSKLRPDMIEIYASILHEEQAVTFEHDDRIYRIWDSTSNEGWYIEILEESERGMWNEELTRIICESPWVEVDGGLCTGDAKDAIEFMLPEETGE